MRTSRPDLLIVFVDYNASSDLIVRDYRAVACIDKKTLMPIWSTPMQPAHVPPKFLRTTQNRVLAADKLGENHEYKRKISALDRSSGKPLWDYTYVSHSLDNTTSLSDEHLWVLETKDGYEAESLHRLSLETGESEWSINVKEHNLPASTEHILWTNNALYITHEDTVSILDQDTGMFHPVWSGHRIDEVHAHEHGLLLLRRNIAIDLTITSILFNGEQKGTTTWPHGTDLPSQYHQFQQLTSDLFVASGNKDYRDTLHILDPITLEPRRPAVTVEGYKFYMLSVADDHVLAVMNPLESNSEKHRALFHFDKDTWSPKQVELPEDFGRVKNVYATKMGSICISSFRLAVIPNAFTPEAS